MDLKDDEIRRCLQQHSDLRDQLGQDLGLCLEPLDPNKPKEKMQSHDILLAEADSILALAEEQFQRGNLKLLYIMAIVNIC